MRMNPSKSFAMKRTRERADLRECIFALRDDSGGRTSISTRECASGICFLPVLGTLQVLSEGAFEQLRRLSTTVLGSCR
jgi:hypothetical protein